MKPAVETLAHPMSRLEFDRPPEHPSPPKRRHFTVDRANRSLVLVRRVVADVIVGHQQMLDLQEIVETAAANGKATRIERCRRKLSETVNKLRLCLDELAEMGVELRDWGLGVVDFPAIAGGREIYLCWQFGEPRVMHWHELDAGDAGRQPLESLPEPVAVLAE